MVYFPVCTPSGVAVLGCSTFLDIIHLPHSLWDLALYPSPSAYLLVYYSFTATIMKYRCGIAAPRKVPEA